jgi:hypothetical protein
MARIPDFYARALSPSAVELEANLTETRTGEINFVLLIFQRS